jgi:eukaryotic-like serine/threonine-protein kinase
MAPEQARCEDLTPATDIYSLGAVLYELAAGQAPFSGPTPVDILLQVLNLDPPSPRKVNPRVPRALAVIISRAMDKDPARRYRSARAMQDDLRGSFSTSRSSNHSPVGSSGSTFGGVASRYWSAT